MSKLKKQYICSYCGSISQKWAGQCFDCGTWGTLEEEIVEKNPGNPKSYELSSVLNKDILEVHSLDSEISDSIRIETSFQELNRVLGGGFVPGSVTLIGGDPGVGKSTMLLQLTALLGRSKLNCLYVTGEESADQVKLRAKRLEVADSAVKILTATNISGILSTVNNSGGYNFVVIDSIQTIYNDDISSSPGTVSQIKNCTQLLINYAKTNNVILVIVGHVTKEGELAGPKLLEHMVDTVLYFEGESHNQYRILRSVKNRFGGVNEIGVFEMTNIGLKEVTNPSALFLMQRDNNVSGSAVFAGIEGSRPLLVEVQALIAPTHLPTPRRSVVGWDNNRLSMILAVLNVRYGLNLSNKEVYLSIAGGLRITEPAIDLAVAAALISAAFNKPLENNSVYFGEIGLSGEVRNVNQAELRINEALKQGYQNIYTSSKIKNFENYIKPILHVKQLKTTN